MRDTQEVTSLAEITDPQIGDLYIVNSGGHRKLYGITPTLEIELIEPTDATELVTMLADHDVDEFQGMSSTGSDINNMVMIVPDATDKLTGVSAGDMTTLISKRHALSDTGTTATAYAIDDATLDASTATAPRTINLETMRTFFDYLRGTKAITPASASTCKFCLDANAPPQDVWPAVASIVDISPSARAITSSGMAFDTTDFKFGSQALQFNSSYIRAAAQSADFAFGTGDFTIEFWYKPVGGGGFIAGVDDGSYSLNSWVIYDSGDTIELKVGNGIDAYEPITIVYVDGLAGAWGHVAFSRGSGTIKSFLDGVVGTSSADTTNIAAVGKLSIGDYYEGGSGYYFGTLDGIVIHKGLARYTGAFTAPTRRPGAVPADVTVGRCEIGHYTIPQRQLAFWDETRAGWYDAFSGDHIAPGDGG